MTRITRLSIYSHHSFSVIKILAIVNSFFWLPYIFFGDCNDIGISNLRWLSDTDELEITFQSKPEKIYELQVSNDLGEFNASSDFAGTVGT